MRARSVRAGYGFETAGDKIRGHERRSAARIATGHNSPPGQGFAHCGIGIALIASWFHNRSIEGCDPLEGDPVNPGKPP
jgi:hypothetical protein